MAESIEKESASPTIIASETEAPKNDIDYSEHSFAIHYIDVGQGDAALVVCDDKTMIIVDESHKIKNPKSHEYICVRENYMDTVIQDNILNIGAKFWDYGPIKLEELPKIFERLKDFK